MIKSESKNGDIRSYPNTKVGQLLYVLQVSLHCYSR